MAGTEEVAQTERARSLLVAEEEGQVALVVLGEPSFLSIQRFKISGLSRPLAAQVARVELLGLVLTAAQTVLLEFKLQQVLQVLDLDSVL